MANFGVPIDRLPPSMQRLARNISEHSQLRDNKTVAPTEQELDTLTLSELDRWAASLRGRPRSAQLKVAKQQAKTLRALLLEEMAHDPSADREG